MPAKMTDTVLFVPGPVVRVTVRKIPVELLKCHLSHGMTHGTYITPAFPARARASWRVFVASVALTDTVLLIHATVKNLGRWLDHPPAPLFLPRRLRDWIPSSTTGFATLLARMGIALLLFVKDR